MTPVLDVLIDARQRLADHDLVKGSFHSYYGDPEAGGDDAKPDAYCLVGAISIVNALYISVLDRLGTAALQLFPTRCDAGRFFAEPRTQAPLLYKFNDDPATTKQDVLAVYDRAITAEKEAHVGPMSLKGKMWGFG